MNNEHLKGAADKAKGAIKDAVGGLTGKPACRSKANSTKPSAPRIKRLTI